MPRKSELLAHLFVFDLKERKQIRRHKVNLYNRRQMEWMHTVMLWATQNNCSVEIVNCIDVVQ